MFSVSAKRKNDAIIQVVQDNTAKEIRVHAMNHAAELLVGEKSSELVGKPFLSLLPADVIEDCKDISFDTDGVALFDVLHHYFMTSIRTKRGHLVPVDMKAFVLPGTHKEFYIELLLHDITLIEKLRELKATLAASQQSATTQMDDVTQLPNRDFLQRCILHVQQMMQNVPVDCVFAVFTVNELAPVLSGTLASAKEYALMRAAGERFKKACRVDDMVGYLGNGVLAAVFVDCRPEHMENISKRIRGAFSRSPLETPEGNQLNATLAISFDAVTREEDVEGLVARVLA